MEGGVGGYRGPPLSDALSAAGGCPYRPSPRPRGNVGAPARRPGIGAVGRDPEPAARGVGLEAADLAHHGNHLAVVERRRIPSRVGRNMPEPVPVTVTVTRAAVPSALATAKLSVAACPAASASVSGSALSSR